MMTLKKFAMFAAVVALGTAGTAQAADTIWTGAANNGLFNDSSNWSAGVPTSKRAVFNVGGTVTVTCSSSVADELAVSGSTTLIIDSGDLEVANAASIAHGSTIDVRGMFKPAALVNNGTTYIEFGGVLNLDAGADVTDSGSGTRLIQNEGQVLISGSGGTTTDISAGQTLADDGSAMWTIDINGSAGYLRINRDYTGVLQGMLEFTSTDSFIDVGAHDFETGGAAMYPGADLCAHTSKVTGGSVTVFGETCP